VSNITDSTIRDMIGDSDAIDFDGSGPERSLIARCLFENGTDDGLDIGANSVDITENVLRGIEDKALSIEENGAQGGASITWNIIHDCGSGMSLKNGLVVTDGHHNTVTHCQEGVELFSKDGFPDGGHASLHSMIVWDNVVDVFFDDLSSVDITFSDIGGARPWPGEGNVFATPRFVDPIADFALRPGSPCVKSGLNGTDMGAVPFTGDPRVTFVRGDSNEDGLVNIADASFTLNHLFLGGPPPSCRDRMDSNDDGILNITDGIYQLNALFTGGQPIRPPYPEPGPDPTDDGIPCL
jgi:hypothetical protein